MTAEERQRLRHIGWNGISLKVPAAWETTVSAKSHLHFERDFSAVVEMRWNTVPANQSDAYIKSTISQIESLLGEPLTQMATPSYAVGLLGGFEQHCYTRQGRKSPSLLLLICRTCSTFLLLQFFNDDLCHHPLESIGSLCCHPTKEENIWSIQDFRVRIPSSFQLSGYNLAAGLTRISLVDKRSLLHICRLAPATIRLRQHSLKEILMTLTGLQKDVMFEGDGISSLRYQQYPSLARQVLLRLQKKRPFCLANLWQVSENDRLLGVIQEGIHPLNPHIFDAVCNSYETFSLEE